MIEHGNDNSPWCVTHLPGIQSRTVRELRDELRDRFECDVFDVVRFAAGRTRDGEICLRVDLPRDHCVDCTGCEGCGRPRAECSCRGSTVCTCAPKT